MHSDKQRILIVGGGASCAARTRRLSEDAQIIMFNRGPDVSFANCGLPYDVGPNMTGTIAANALRGDVRPTGKR